MSYLAYHFTVDPPQPGTEILIAMISDFGFESFDTGENGFSAYITVDKEEISEQVDLLHFDDFEFSYTIEKMEEKNWNAEWENNFEPVIISDLLCIRAPFHAKNNDVKREIVIMPKMSFGTGHHQTTRLMCEEMFGLGLEGKTVLDMGTGTGILAILAAQLGAKNITGIDIDEWSVENAIENCAANGFKEIMICKGDVDLLAGQVYNVILANINKNILKKQLPHYSTSLSKGGNLFLSGFFTTDADDLKKCAADNGFDFVKMSNEEEWALLSFIKR